MLQKVVVSELFGQIDLELKLDSNTKLTMFTAANGYGKSTLLQIIDAFYRGDLAYISSVNFNTIQFYLLSNAGNTKQLKPPNTLHRHSICFTKVQPNQLSFTICDEQSGQISEPQQFDCNDFSESLSSNEISEICQRLTLNSDTQIDIWGNDEYAQTCLEATVNQHPEAVHWHQQLYPKQLQSLLGTSCAQLIDCQRQNFPFILNQDDFTEQQTLSLIEQSAKDLAFHFSHKAEQYHTTCEKLNNSFAKRLIDKNTQHSQLDAKSWHNQYQTLYKNIEKVLAYGLLSKQELDLPAPQDMRQDDIKLLSLFVQDSKVKFAPYQKLMDKIQLFTAMVNQNLTFKAITIDVNHGFEIYNDSQQHIELTTLSDGEQQMIVLLYQIIMLCDDNQLLLIDTIETGLNSQWQINIKAQLKALTDSYNCQFIIATHSAHLIGNEKALQTKRCDHCGHLH